MLFEERFDHRENTFMDIQLPTDFVLRGPPEIKLDQVITIKQEKREDDPVMSFEFDVPYNYQKHCFSSHMVVDDHIEIHSQQGEIPVKNEEKRELKIELSVPTISAFQEHYVLPNKEKTIIKEEPVYPRFSVKEPIRLIKSRKRSIVRSVKSRKKKPEPPKIPDHILNRVIDPKDYKTRKEYIIEKRRHYKLIGKITKPVVIEYGSRKSFAETRPRVGGRFVKFTSVLNPPPTVRMKWAKEQARQNAKHSDVVTNIKTESLSTT